MSMSNAPKVIPSVEGMTGTYDVVTAQGDLTGIYFDHAVAIARLVAKGTDLLAATWAIIGMEDTEEQQEGPCCSICDGLGHGYPGGRPCPLEERGWDDDPRGF
jgi:hypothetical protein